MAAKKNIQPIERAQKEMRGYSETGNLILTCTLSRRAEVQRIKIERHNYAYFDKRKAVGNVRPIANSTIGNCDLFFTEN